MILGKYARSVRSTSVSLSWNASSAAMRMLDKMSSSQKVLRNLAGDSSVILMCHLESMMGKVML